MASITPKLDVSQFRAMGSAKSRLVSVQAENAQTVVGNSGQQDLYFAIPSSSMSMLNSQLTALTFDLVCSSACSFSNGGANSIIQGVEVIIGNQSVELLDRCNVFSALMEDHQSKSRAQNIGSILSGHGEFVKDTVGGSATASIDPVKSGKDLTTKIRVSIPLYSSTLGLLASNYLPLVDGIRLRLTLASNDIALQYASGTPAYTMTRIALNMDYLDINPAVYSQLLAESGGVFKFHSTGVANFNNTLQPAGNHTILIPARYSSIKNYFVVFRRNDTNGNNGSGRANKNTTGGRYYPNLQNYVFRIEGRNYPAIPITVSDGTTSYGGESFQEGVKCFHASHSPDFDVVYNNSQYLRGDGVTAGTQDSEDGAFFLGLDFEESGAGAIRGLVSGINTIDSNTFLELKLDANNISMDSDTFSVFDLVIEFDVMSGSIVVSK